MKGTLAVIAILYVLYNKLFNITVHKVNSVTYRVIHKSDIVKERHLLERGKKKTGGRRDRKSTTQAYLIWLLLLSGDVELNPGPISCDTCGRTFNRKARLENHQAKATPVSCDLCDKRFCFENRLHQHLRTDHIGGSGIVERGDGVENSVNSVIYPDTGHANTTEYQQIIDKHYAKIRTHRENTKNWRKINRQLPLGFTYEDLKVLLEEVRSTEHSAFKINIGFGSMLYDTVNQVYRYYYVSTNNLLFDKAFTISINRDMTDFFNKIFSLDLLNNYYLKRPSSGWVLAGLPNVEIRIYRMRQVPIGTGVELPAYVKGSKSIISLTHHKTKNYAYEDNLCLFRCLTLHFGASLRSLEREATRLKEKLEQHTGKSYDQGIEVGMLANVEIYFNIAINVYSLQEDLTAKVIRLSKLDHDVMHLNLHENHFSYIKRFNSYAKKYTCTICGRILNRSDNLIRHAKECSTETEEIYIGGKYRNKKNLFELLESIGINVLEEHRYEKYFTCYDFEALQVPLEDELLGRKLHFEHVAATVSICSNLTGHTEPIHHASKGDPQTLCDTFIESLLVQQVTKAALMTETFKPYIITLEQSIKEDETELGITVTDDEGQGEVAMDVEQGGGGDDDGGGGGGVDEEVVMEEDDTEDDVLQTVGSKRRRGGGGGGGGGRHDGKRFLMNEADCSDDDGEDDEDDDSEYDVEGLIDDHDGGVEENDASFYRALDNNREVVATAVIIPPPTTTPVTNTIEKDRQVSIKMKILKKKKAYLSKLMTYINQLTVLGFNSQKYDVPLIRKYLASSLMKADCPPQFIIKKMGGYMAISTPKLKFLDITNYLAAGTSLSKFYASYGVTTAKGFFPYSWFDSLDKLETTSLPEREEFHSILTKETITLEEHQLCKDVWIREEMVTFADFVRYYNNTDVVGFVEAVEKMVANERANKLDMFKESVSLPGLTLRYLFMNLDPNDYFVGFAREHKHLAKLLKDNIVGGPSIIFHRYHEKDVTLIKGKHLCKKVIGYDANSLYLYCLAQNMPTGFYDVLEKKNNYAKEVRYSSEAIQWLEHIMRTTEGVHIRHAENGGEKRIENCYVDGYDESTRTVYEYHGCFWHKHFCHAGYDADTWNDTVKKENTLRDLGYNVVSITSCVWKKTPESSDWYPPQVAPTAPTKTQEEIITDIENDVIEGLVVYSVHVPDEKKARFSEFPPIFKNCEITIADIGEHMQAYCRSIERKSGVKRSLISSMHGENILTHTAIIKQYLKMGLVITNVETVIVYNGKSVFNWFMDEVCRDRRLADLGGEEFQVKGDASKLKGNSGYGGTLMDKLKHTRVSFVKERNLAKQLNNPLFKHYDELNERIFEVEKMKKKVLLDLPIQIGITVYSYAKLRLIQFWDFINTFLVNDLYQLMECDTDSLYIAFARDTIDECVKPEMLETWETEKLKWLVSEDEETKTDFEGNTITLAQYDKRTPGKFKPEFVGVGLICLNSKVYHSWGYDKDGKLIVKTSAKGCQKKRNELLKSHFLNVLETQKHFEVENAGFIKDSRGVINTYTQKKKGLGYFYGKRKVLDDGVSTTHLDI